MKKLFSIVSLCFITALCLIGCDNYNPSATAVTSQDTQIPSETEIAESSEPTTISIPLQSKIKMTDEQRAEKVAYITIDDGPSKNTPAILQVLREKGVKATFFVIGRNAERNPEYLKAIAADGNVIGNHSYSHVYKQIYDSPDTLKDEIVHTNSIIKSILGEDYSVTLFRFPGGLKQNDPAYVQVVYDLGMDYFAWSVDPQDSLGNKSSTDEIVAKFREQLKNQQHPVILLHDANNKDTTIQALGIIIDELRAQGYSFDVIQKIDA